MILFELTRPTIAYVGQKDYQQALIIQRLVRDLRLPLRVRVLPTVRERDGLAMSSRNAFLSPAERRRAVVLFDVLREARGRIRAGERRAGPLLSRMRRRLVREAGARVDCVAAADARTLAPLRRLRGRVALLLAARIGRTRLIDNLLVDVS
jgi:pantoate--beta-alanine ligase